MAGENVGKALNAMVFLNMIALVIYTILEWVVRRQTPGRKPSWTARAILETFEELAVTVSVAENGCIQWLLPNFSPTQVTLWQIFGLSALFEYVKLALNRVALWAT